MPTAHATGSKAGNALIATTHTSKGTKYTATGAANQTLGAFKAYGNGEAEGWTVDGQNFTDLAAWTAHVAVLSASSPTLI